MSGHLRKFRFGGQLFDADAGGAGDQPGVPNRGAVGVGEEPLEGAEGNADLIGGLLLTANAKGFLDPGPARDVRCDGSGVSRLALCVTHGVQTAMRHIWRARAAREVLQLSLSMNGGRINRRPPQAGERKRVQYAMSDVWQVPYPSEISGLTSTYGDPVAVEEEAGKRFAALLREYRLAAKLKQEDVAERSGVSLRTISRWEGGDLRRPELEDVKAVCRVIGLSTVLAGVALGLLAPEDVEHLPEPPPPPDPMQDEAIAILRDPEMPEETKRAALHYLRYLRAQTEREQPGTDEPRAAS